MTRNKSSRNTTLRIPVMVVAAVAIAAAAGITVMGGRVHSPSPQSLVTALSATGQVQERPPALRPPALPSGDGDDSPAALGIVPDGVTVFDDELPAMTNLDPTLRTAVRRAASDAASDGIVFYVNSGWRSAEYQERLLREAIATYGSREEAARWVATADTSAHVSGEAIDIGQTDAMSWLAQHGARYGLCQVYVNEPWHYELRPEAAASGCPAMYLDPTEDPRSHSR